MSGSCELIGSRSSGQSAPLVIDVPARCKGRPCDLILVSSLASSFASFRYIQDVPGTEVGRDWLSEGANRGNIDIVGFANLGRNGENQELIASIELFDGRRVNLYDDLLSQNNRDKWSLIVNNAQGSLYLC
ncbi:hypothetical protein CO038_03485 [Candidatus Pacearchaeota archaeon CG_4_9_14_0_2_um_filter_39_13]|nr:hypothetical protein [Candidatus Pacearchaeota archaeon]OIO43598.1 MAG: hypothetical protein AUJ64_01970 [Candidatus Pacearchaeota archaeon CG1_02_39_14]PJC44480.1 MAG: hypothetical protein CO038_03485 [Candidatus Pacearchaeota archaeon CG_4_9_14_0_2_um_filter_39_13]